MMRRAFLWCIPVLLGLLISCRQKEQPFHLVDRTTAISELKAFIQLENNHYLVEGVSNDGQGADDIVLMELESTGDTCWITEYGSPFNDNPFGMAEHDGTICVLYSASYPDSGDVLRVAQFDEQGTFLRERTVQSDAEGPFSYFGDVAGNSYLLSEQDGYVQVQKVSPELEIVWTRQFLQSDESLGLMDCHFVQSGSNLLVIGYRLGSIVSCAISFDGELIGSDQESIDGFFWTLAACPDRNGGAYAIGSIVQYGGTGSSCLLRIGTEGTILSSDRLVSSFPEDLELTAMACISDSALILVGCSEEGSALFALINAATTQIEWTEAWRDEVLTINQAVPTNSGNLLAIGAHRKSSNVNHSAMAICTPLTNPSAVPPVDLQRCDPWNLVFRVTELEPFLTTSYNSNSDAVLLFNPGSSLAAVSPYSGDTLGIINVGHTAPISMSEGGLLLVDAAGNYQIFDGNYQPYREVQADVGYQFLKPIAWGPEGIALFSDLGSPPMLTLLGWDGHPIWTRNLSQDTSADYMSSCIALGDFQQFVTAYYWFLVDGREAGTIRLQAYDADGSQVWRDSVLAPRGEWFTNFRLWPVDGHFCSMLCTELPGCSSARVYDQTGFIVSEQTADPSSFEEMLACPVFMLNNADTLLNYSLYGSWWVGGGRTRITEIGARGDLWREYILQSDNWNPHLLSVTRDGDIVACGSIWDSLAPTLGFSNENVFAAVITDETTIENLSPLE